MTIEENVNVAIIGAGPAGIGVALGLAKQGVKSILLIERQEKIGGIPSLYRKNRAGIRTFLNLVRARIIFGEDYVNLLNEKLLKSEVDILLESKVLEISPKENKLSLVNPDKGKFTIKANVFILACGARENTLMELGWIMGSRPANMYFSKSLLELSDQHDILPMRKPVIIGSDLNAFAAAAKLRRSGASNANIIENKRNSKTPFHKRLYFNLFNSKPNFHGNIESVKIVGKHSASAVELSNGKVLNCDGIVVCGDLIPNSELALENNLKVETPSRKPVVASNYQLSEPGWFAAGNMLGDGFHGAEWCYHNGLRVAKKVADYLNSGK